MNIFLYTISITLAIFMPVAAAVALRRRFSVAWSLFCVGMATFVGSQLFHIPLNKWLTDIGVIGDVSPDATNLIITVVVLGLSAGLSESIARAVGYAILFRRGAAGQREDGIMVGLGHGGIEAMLIGGVLVAASVSSLWALQGMDLATLELSAAELTAVTEQLALITAAPYLTFLPLLERALAILLHVVLSVLVWTAFKRRQGRWFVAAVLYHAFVDGSIVYTAQFVENMWLLEGLLALLLLPGAIWLWKVRPSSPHRPIAPLRQDVGLFLTAVSHELRYQWQSKRLLILVVVFILFGLMSPLVAKFTPEILKSVEGAEQFADMIPEPTIADAIGQYIKNITQFGFILAIVMGMGAVAGEKERGTAAIILSKPLPRWAFLMSKFVAQTAVFAVAFLAAGLGAYYYTTLLFEPIPFLPFMAGNGLLLVWLLVFSAVTLLASTIARTTAVSAGIAFGGAIVLFVAGSIPKWGGLAPSGLVAWASDSSLVNGGALAMSVVLIVVLLITAVGVFETQEL